MNSVISSGLIRTLQTKKWTKGCIREYLWVLTWHVCESWVRVRGGTVPSRGYVVVGAEVVPIDTVPCRCSRPSHR